MSSVNFEGVNFGNIMINNKELFIEIFSQHYNQNSIAINTTVQQLNTVLQTMGKDVNQSNANAFNAAWEQFRSVVMLLSNPQQLLVMYRGAGGKVEQISDLVNQNDVMGSGNLSMNQSTVAYGIKSGDLFKNEVQHAAKASEVEEFLQEHVGDFIKKLNTPITNTEANSLHKYHSNLLKQEYLGKDKTHLSGKLWYQPFYREKPSQFYGGQSMGQVYDAFMNHIANFKPALYDALSRSNVAHLTTTNLFVKEDIFTEEGGVKKSGNFPRLLHESKNNISWYSGGDIIIVDQKSMAVVYNIQLKSTGKNVQSIFGVRVAQLRDFISILMGTLGNPQAMAEVLYKHLLTKISNTNSFSGALQKDVEEIIKQSLTNGKYATTFNFS